MAIKQIAVSNGATWGDLHDIGADASNIDLSPSIFNKNTVQTALNYLENKIIGTADISGIGSDIAGAIRNLNDNKVSKSGDTVSGILNFTQNQPLQFIDPNTLDKNGSIYHDTGNDISSIIAINAQRKVQGVTKSNIFQIGVNPQGEPEVFVGGYALNQTNITVDTAWRNAIKAFGKYGDEEHYGSMFIQPTPNDPDVTADLSQGVTDKNWSGIAFRDKNDQEMSLVRSYSRAKTSSANSITGFQIDSRYRNWGSSNALIGRNILEIGVDEIGNPIVNIQAVGATAADNRTSYARAAWRKAIGIQDSANSTTAGLLSPALYTKISNNVVTHLGILNKQFNFTVTSSSTLDNIDISYNGNNPYNLLYIPIGIIGVRHTEPTISIDQYYISSDNETLMYRVTNSSNSQISATATFTILYINYNNQTLSS